MCDYQTLYHGAHGYVIRCPHCKNIQLAFGTSVVNLSVQEFNYFNGMVQRLSAECPSYTEPGEKVLCLPLPADHVMMLLTREEVNTLADITSEVKALTDTYEILDTTFPSAENI